MRRKTKIVCTIGPATESCEMLKKMIQTGMNVARINCSHGNYEEYEMKINHIRQVAKELNAFVGIMIDTKGPEIRCGYFENGMQQYKQGDKVYLVKEKCLGNQQRFQVCCPELFDDIQVGNTILIDDGKFILKVLSCNENEIYCEFQNPAIIKDRKGINVPGVTLSMPFISEQDYKDIEFACKQDVDTLALSFVRKKEDVLAVKKLLQKFGKPDIALIAKIESQQGVDHLKDILEVADGIMVARGDLGVEVLPEKVPLYQKEMIKMANQMGKVVITATHMLESMINSPRPTRAEVNDVANAIFDGTDAIMLSGESAIGKYPVESVEMMDKIALSVEGVLDYRNDLYRSVKSSQRTKNDAIGISVAECCLTLENVSAIFAFTETGGTAKRIRKFRPNVPIIACSDSPRTCQKMCYYWGVYPIIAKYENDLVKWDEEAQRIAKYFEFEKGTTLILTSGMGQKHGSTNTIRIIEVE